MVNFKNLADKAKAAVDKRGGMDSVKGDAEQLKNIAKGGGSFSDKAKAAAEALKTPGGGGDVAPTVEQPTPSDRTPPTAEQPTPSPQDPEAKGSDKPADKPRGENRGDRDREKHHGHRKGAHRGQGGRGEGGDPKPEA